MPATATKNAGKASAAGVLAELEALGTAQNRKIYRRHGVGGEMFGVSYANLDKLKKRLGTDPDLARELWASGNHDARVLATKIADPAAMAPEELDAWAAEPNDYVLADAVSSLVARSPHALAKHREWSRSSDEFVGQAGWGLLASLALKDDDLDEAFLEERLETIERDVHARPNRTRHAMNMALIAIGGRSESLREKAVAAARRIGKVEVDHGETSCKTPAAEPYIEKMWARKRKKR